MDSTNFPHQVNFGQKGSTSFEIHVYCEHKTSNWSESSLNNPSIDLFLYVTAYGNWCTLFGVLSTYQYSGFLIRTVVPHHKTEQSPLTQNPIVRSEYQ